MKSLHIIYRSCAVVKTMSKTAKRPFNLEKPTLILKSLKSLLESCKFSELNDKIKIDIIDDSSPQEFRKKMKELLASYTFNYKIHELSFKNNGKSLKYSYDLAKEINSDIIYFCEDDYLHLKNAIKEIMEAYNQKIIGTSEFCVHPTDYPDRYVKIYPSYIFISSNRHWRSIAQTTGTLFVTRNIFNKFQDNFYKLAEINSGKIGGGEDQTLNKIFDDKPCLSPLPSLAAHMNDDTLPPFIDWKVELDNTII